MALNIAVPLTTVGDLMDSFGLLSPISPLSVDCRGVMAAAAAAAAGTHKKQMVSPVGSESSGVSSLDSDEMKKPSSPPTTPTEEVDRPTSSSPLPSEMTLVQDSSRSSSESSSARSSLSSTSSESESGASSEQESSEVAVVAVADVPKLSTPPKECKLVLGGRDVLNLMDNLTAPNHFRLQFAQLPENDNIHFFLDNRSQYHRLGANGHIQEYTMVGCKRCDFRYPVNGTSLTSGGPTATMGQSSLAAAFPQQQQQQQQLQWNNMNSIANSRDKMSLNAAANAFTSKTFGGGNQYFRNGGGSNAMGAAAAPLFGRDSNRGGSATNFLTASSTGSYNNHKTYQQQQQLQNFNGGKFNNYQQQQFFSKNQQLRYGQSSGGFNAMATAIAANQNLANFNGKGSSGNNNNNNMFAYYKTMM